MTETTAAPRPATLLLPDVGPGGSPVVQDRPAAAPRRRLRAHPVLVGIAVYAALAVLVYLPIGPFDGHHIPRAGLGNPASEDPYQMIWFLSWLPYALTHGQSLFHTNFMEYPYGVNLADNTSVPLLGLLAWPITATLGPVAAFNFLLRLSFAASATSMFLVARRWCRSWRGPFLAGLLYAFGPYTAAQSQHLDLIFIPLPPILVLLCDELVRRQRMRPALLGLLIGVVVALQYLVSPDVTSGCYALGLVAAVGLSLRFRHEVRARLPYVLTALPAALVSFAVLGGYPVYEMFAGPDHLTGPVIRVVALQQTQADLLGTVIPTSNQLAEPSVLTHLGNEFVNGNLSENGSYLGLPMIVLVVLTIRRLRHEAGVMAFAGLALAAFLLSLGPKLVIGTWHSPVPLPELVYAHLPLLDDTLPVRYSLYVLLFVAMIVAIGLDRLWPASREGAAGVPARPRRSSGGPLRTIGFAAAGAVVVFSLLPNVPHRSHSMSFGALPAAIGRAVRPGAVVLAFPLPTPWDTDALAWQAVDHMRFRLIGGYANIAVPGQRVGRRYPLLLPPDSVEELLADAVSADKLPPPPLPTPAIEAQLRQFLRRYSVGAVAAWTGPESQASALEETTIYTYLVHALGPPKVQGGNFDIWVPTHGDWPRPPA